MKLDLNLKISSEHEGIIIYDIIFNYNYFYIVIRQVYIKGEKISPTKSTPEVILNPEGKIVIKGRLMNKGETEFYKQIEGWIDMYVSNPAEITTVDIGLEYFNGVNSVIFISLLKKITQVNLKNKRIVFNWYYEDGDEDILEMGEFISTVLNVPFNFIMTSDEF
jgi:hypothetical protein